MPLFFCDGLYNTALRNNISMVGLQKPYVKTEIFLHIVGNTNNLILFFIGDQTLEPLLGFRSLRASKNSFSLVYT